MAMVCTLWVYFSYRAQLNKSRRHEFSGDLTNEQNRKLRAVAYRAILYTLAYMNTFIWPLLARVIAVAIGADHSGEPLPSGIFVFSVISYFFYPLQGTFNYYIYTRPNYRELKRIHVDAGWLELNWRVWKGESGDSSSSILHAQRSRRISSQMSARQQSLELAVSQPKENSSL